MKVGIDIIENKRLEGKEEFLNRILSTRELDIYNSRNKSLEFLGGRWAAKEAFLKALQQSILAISLNEIEVLNKENGAPYIQFKERIYENVSISHEKEYSIAMVIIDE